jgi:hypothetical protein
VARAISLDADVNDAAGRWPERAWEKIKELLRPLLSRGLPPVALSMSMRASVACLVV